MQEEITEFLNSGICISRNPKTGKIDSIFHSKFRFRIPAIHKAMYGEDVDYHISIHTPDDSSSD